MAVPVIVVPVVLAIVIAATLLPLMNRLLRLGWTRGVAAAATTFGATVAIVAAFRSRSSGPWGRCGRS